jgi:hypothetical protein
VIWLLPHSLPPTPCPPVSKLSLFLCLPVCRWSSLVTERGRGPVGEEPNHTTARKPGHLHLNLLYILSKAILSKVDTKIYPLVISKVPNSIDKINIMTFVMT